jgi:hypothetical protein
MAYVGYLSQKSSQEIGKFPKNVKLWLPVHQKKFYRKLPLKQKGPYFITKLDRRDSNYEAIISRQLLKIPT